MPEHFVPLSPHDLANAELDKMLDDVAAAQDREAAANREILNQSNLCVHELIAQAKYAATDEACHVITEAQNLIADPRAFTNRWPHISIHNSPMLPMEHHAAQSRSLYGALSDAILSRGLVATHDHDLHPAAIAVQFVCIAIATRDGYVIDVDDSDVIDVDDGDVIDVDDGDDSDILPPLEGAELIWSFAHNPLLTHDQAMETLEAALEATHSLMLQHGQDIGRT